MLSTKWIIPQNSCDIDQMHTTIQTFKNLNGVTKEKEVLNQLMQAQSYKGLYHPRTESTTYDVSSANHKIDEAEFYGAIYETPNGKIHVSSYGELLLKHWGDEEKRNKIFLGMSYNVQFPHPNKPGLEEFEVYPLRLILNLLLEKKLDYKLSNVEVAQILYDVKTVKNKEEYSKIVDAILSFRNKDDDSKKIALQTNATNFIKNYVSCNYLFNIFRDLNIISECKTDDRYKIKSPLRSEPTNITPRIFKINHQYIDFLQKLNSLEPVYDDAKKCEGQLKSDWIQDVYDTIPEEILVEINEKDEMFTKYLQIPHLLKEASVDSEKWAEFEQYISDAYNLFSDVESERLGQPGEPDALCKFMKNNTTFTADGKSTSGKLGSINAGRLKQHRDKYGADYTIIVTPKYTPSAIQDIKGTRVCVITSFCFAELVTNYIFKFYEEKKECSYEPIDKIVHENLGTDLSEKIYKLIDDQIGVSKKAFV